MPSRLGCCLALALLVTLLSPTPSAAGSCVRWDTRGRFVVATAVFQGRVLSVLPAATDPVHRQSVTLDVTTVWKGSLPTTITIENNLAGADQFFVPEYQPGTEYLIYASHAFPQGLITHLCSRALPTTQASADLADFAALGASPHFPANTLLTRLPAQTGPLLLSKLPPASFTFVLLLGILLRTYDLTKRRTPQ